MPRLPPRRQIQTLHSRRSDPWFPGHWRHRWRPRASSSTSATRPPCSAMVAASRASSTLQPCWSQRLRRRLGRAFRRLLWSHRSMEQCRCRRHPAERRSASHNLRLTRSRNGVGTSSGRANSVVFGNPDQHEHVRNFEPDRRYSKLLREQLSPTSTAVVNERRHARATGHNSLQQAATAFGGLDAAAFIRHSVSARSASYEGLLDLYRLQAVNNIAGQYGLGEDILQSW